MPKKGMVEKNRRRLRQFDLPANQAALLSLPGRVLVEVRRVDDGGRSCAVRVMYALAVEILTVAPMRIGNLVRLELNRHLVRVRRGKTMTLHIVIPPEETKTGVPFEMALPGPTADFVDAFVRKFRNRVGSERSPYLFAGRGDKARTIEAFSSKLSGFVRRETGLEMHPHLFRQLAGKLYLDQHPEDIETVRRILGHTSTRTTLRAYSEQRSEQAFRRYDQTVDALRGRSAKPVLPGRSVSLGGGR